MRNENRPQDREHPAVIVGAAATGVETSNLEAMSALPETPGRLVAYRLEYAYICASDASDASDGGDARSDASDAPLRDYSSGNQASDPRSGYLAYRTGPSGSFSLRPPVSNACQNEYNHRQPYSPLEHVAPAVFAATVTSPRR